MYLNNKCEKAKVTSPVRLYLLECNLFVSITLQHLQSGVAKECFGWPGNNGIIIGLNHAGSITLHSQEIWQFEVHQNPSNSCVHNNYNIIHNYGDTISHHQKFNNACLGPNR